MRPFHDWSIRNKLTGLFIAMACGSLFSAPAQLFSPESWNGAFWGALIGGLAAGHGRHGLSQSYYGWNRRPGETR